MSRRLPLAVLCLAALVLTACGGSSPEDLLDGAPDAFEDAGTSRFEMRVTAAGEGIDSAYSATGEQDLEAGTMRMDAELGLESTSTQTLVIGEVMYLRSPLFAVFTGDEEVWVRIDMEESGREAGLDVDTLVEGNTGPAALLQQLRGAADDVEELGDDEVRGVSTTQLRVQVDTERAIENSPAETREQLRTFAEASGMPDIYPMEVWIDDDGLPRRISTVVDVEDERAGTVTQQTVLELFDFGVDVSVEEPEDVVELDQLLGELDALEEGLGLEDDPGAGLEGDPDAGLGGDGLGDPGPGDPGTDPDGDPGEDLDELQDQLDELEQGTD